jgi:hypothetical protein
MVPEHVHAALLRRHTRLTRYVMSCATDRRDRTIWQHGGVV